MLETWDGSFLCELVMGLLLLSEQASQVLNPRSSERGLPRRWSFPCFGILWDDEPYVGVGFNTYLRLSVQANFLKPETKSSSGKLRKKKTPK